MKAMTRKTIKLCEKTETENIAGELLSETGTHREFLLNKERWSGLSIAQKVYVETCLVAARNIEEGTSRSFIGDLN